MEVTTNVVDVLIAVPIIAGLVQVVKRPAAHYGLDLSPLAPLLALLLGVAGGVAGAIEGGWLPGVVAGLSASGLYSGAKASVVEPIQDHRHKVDLDERLG